MSTEPNTNLNAVELTQSELDSVAGGGISAAQAAMDQAAAQATRAHAALAQQAVIAYLNDAVHKTTKGVGASIKSAIG
jgi:hypothetical protein